MIGRGQGPHILLQLDPMQASEEPLRMLLNPSLAADSCYPDLGERVVMRSSGTQRKDRLARIQILQGQLKRGPSPANAQDRDTEAPVSLSLSGLPRA